MTGGCAQFVTADLHSNVLSSARSTGTMMLYNTSFTADALPLHQGEEHSEAEMQVPSEFLTYLFNGMLSPDRSQGACGSCYSFSITAAVGYTLSLAYRRLGGYFSARYMSQQYIVTCYEVEGAICGCNGGDLAKALAFISDNGIPSFRQFPYVNGPDVVTPDATNHYICGSSLQRGNSLSTCGPCKPDEPSYEDVLSRAELESGLVKDASPLIQIEASCLPCNSVGGPMYFPKPCRIFDPAKSLDENTALAKRLLVRYGPFCTALRMNQEDFLKLDAHAPLLPLSSRPVYAPEFAPAATAPLHAVLVIGYSDVGARDEAVWICRNSWGDSWGSFVPDAPELGLSLEGDVIASVRTVGGLFLVAMYRRTDTSGILEHAVSVCDVLIREPDDKAPRPIGIDDVFVVPFPPRLREVLATSGQLHAERNDRSRQRRRSLLVAAALLGLALLVGALLLVF